MSDSYPESFSIEIERVKLCRYWRRLWTYSASMPCSIVGLFGGFAIGMPPKRRDFESVMDVVTTAGWSLAISVVLMATLLGLVYVFFIRRIAKREADALYVAVEGPFLRIKEGVTNVKDRKLHFRAIVDYVYFQDSNMRKCGIEGLQLNTIGSGLDATIRIRGIKNALEVRDMLSMIDAQRENV